MNTVDALINAREIMTEYFKEQGYSRVPSDYAEEFLHKHFGDARNNISRDCCMIKTSLRRALTCIAYEIMNDGEINKHLIDRL